MSKTITSTTKGLTLRAITATDKVAQAEKTRQSAQWGTYTPDQRYQFFTSTKYVALTGDGRMDEFHADSYIP